MDGVVTFTILQCILSPDMASGFDFESSDFKSVPCLGSMFIAVSHFIATIAHHNDLRTSIFLHDAESPIEASVDTSPLPSPAAPESVALPLVDLDCDDQRAVQVGSVAPSVEVELIDHSDDARIAQLLEDVRQGLLVAAPERISNGVNGTYFLKNKDNRRVGIFKPANEEFSGLHPDSHAAHDAASEWGLLPGESMKREAAAYRVARTHSTAQSDFIDVPPTALVRIRSPSSVWSSTISGAASMSASMMAASRSMSATDDGDVTEWIEMQGSLQMFVEADGDCDELGPDSFEAEDVHKIGILDLCILNCDRNSENMLVKRLDDEEETYRLVPIDHGLSMPGSLSLGYGRFEWLNWPQSRQPFSPQSLRYIQGIEEEQTMNMLRTVYEVRSECTDAMRVSTRFLKMGAAAGLSLYSIGSAVCRNDPDFPSQLEEAYETAKLAAPSIPDDHPDFQKALGTELDALIVQLAAAKPSRRLF